jgi:hypothetical protein
MRRYARAPVSAFVPRLELIRRLFPGSDSSRPTLVAMKGIVFDVTKNPMYSATGSYKGKRRTRQAMDFCAALRLRERKGEGN